MTEPDETEKKVRDVVIEAYYADRVRVGSAARTRAQAAQSILTVFAGALVATFTFAALNDHDLWTRIAGCMAVGLWLTAAILYVWAVAVAAPAPIGPPTMGTEAAAVISALLTRADHERANVDRRQKWANYVSFAALVCTVSTFVLAVFLPKPDETAHGVILLTAGGRRTMAALCGTSSDRLEGEIQKGSVDAGAVAVTVKTCDNRKDVKVSVPKAAVASLYTWGE